MPKNNTSNSELTLGITPQRIFKLEDDAKCIELLGNSKIIPANTIILTPGLIIDYCYYIKSGMVLVYGFKYNGSERDYNILLDNSLLCESNMFLGEQTSFYFKTLKETELVCIEKEALINAMKENQKITNLVLKSLSQKFLSAMNEIHQSRFYNADWRICQVLLMFAEHLGEKYDGKILIKHKISQQMLSNLLGVNRLTTIRALKTLKDDNIIEIINGFYCIRDIDELKKYQSTLEFFE